MNKQKSDLRWLRQRAKIEDESLVSVGGLASQLAKFERPCVGLKKREPPPHVPGEIIIGFRANVSPDNARALLRNLRKGM